MAKTITLNFEDVEYTLEFTKETVSTLEKSGFNIDKVSSSPMTYLPMLFSGSFMAHHRFVKKDTIDKIYSALPNKIDLVGKLAEMYNEPIEAMLDEPEESEGNASWGANW